MFKATFKDLNGVQLCGASFDTEEDAQSFVDEKLNKPYCFGKEAAKTMIPHMVTNIVTPEIREPIIDGEGNHTGEYNITISSNYIVENRGELK